MQLAELKRYNVETADMESLVEMYAYGQMMVSAFRNLEDDGLEVPDWLESKTKKIRRQIIEKQEDMLRKRMADAQLKLENLKTPAEKKREIQNEIKRLKAAIGEE